MTKPKSTRKHKRVVSGAPPSQTEEDAALPAGAEMPATASTAIEDESDAPAAAPIAPVAPAAPAGAERYRGLLIGLILAAIALLAVVIATSGGGNKPVAAPAQAVATVAANDPAFAELDRTDIAALMTCGKDLYDQGKFDDAVRVYKEVIRLKPDNQPAQSNLGSSYFRLQRLDEALAAFREAVRLNGNDAEARQNLGAGLAATGDLDAAIAQYQAALNLKPDLAPALYSLGVLYQEQGAKDKAIEQLQRFLAVGADAQLRADAQQRLQMMGAK